MNYQVGDYIKFGDGVWITIPAFTVLEVSSPDWDGDKPETHETFRVVLKETIIAQVGAKNEYFQGQILDIKE